MTNLTKAKVTYIKCPNVTCKRYPVIAQIPTATGDLYCTACGCDHSSGLDAREILVKIKAHLRLAA